MKRLLVTILVIIFSIEPMACYASSTDGLAVAIDEMVKNEDEVNYLCNVYNIKSEKVATMSESELVTLLNKEIRHSFGHTVVNLFRDEYEPDYLKILVGALDKAELLEDGEEKTITEEDAEERIFAYLMQQAKERILREQGIEAWEKISREVDKEAKRLLKEGKIDKNEYDKLKDTFIATSATGGLVLAHFSGLVVYQLGTKLFWMIARELGLHIAMTTGTKIAVSAVGVMMGPVGIAITAVVDVWLLGKTNWPRTYAALSLVSAHNMQKRYQAELEKLNEEEKANTITDFCKNNTLSTFMILVVLLLVAVVLYAYYRKLFWILFILAIIGLVFKIYL